jgi:hypothetical protein
MTFDLEKDGYPKYLSYLKRIDVWVSGIDLDVIWKNVFNF